jgi:hypothetical protein
VQTQTKLALLSALILSATAACGGSGSGTGGGGGGGGGKNCGTMAAPQILTLKDVQPQSGSSVPNQDVVHAFTIVDAPAQIQSLTLVMPGGKHTAGTPDPTQWSFTVTQMGTDLRYEAGPVTWATAPGNVYVQVPEKFQAQDGCVYALPDPLFSYSVVPGGTGGAGGGMGGPDAGADGG